MLESCGGGSAGAGAWWVRFTRLGVGTVWKRLAGFGALCPEYRAREKDLPIPDEILHAELVAGHVPGSWLYYYSQGDLVEIGAVGGEAYYDVAWG
jgi:hypothetical protein